SYRGPADTERLAQLALHQSHARWIQSSADGVPQLVQRVLTHQRGIFNNSQILVFQGPSSSLLAADFTRPLRRQSKRSQPKAAAKIMGLLAPVAHTSQRWAGRRRGGHIAR